MRIKLLIIFVFLVGFVKYSRAEPKLAYINSDMELVYDNQKHEIFGIDSVSQFSIVRDINGTGFFYAISEENFQYYIRYYAFNYRNDNLYFVSKLRRCNDYSCSFEVVNEEFSGNIKTAQVIDPLLIELSVYILCGVRFYPDFLNGVFVWSEGERIIIEGKEHFSIAEMENSIKFGYYLMNPVFSSEGKYITYVENVPSRPMTSSFDTAGVIQKRIIHAIDIFNGREYTQTFPDVYRLELNDETGDVLILLTPEYNGLSKLYLVNVLDRKPVFIDFVYSAGWL